MRGKVGGGGDLRVGRAGGTLGRAKAVDRLSSGSPPPSCSSEESRKWDRPAASAHAHMPARPALRRAEVWEARCGRQPDRPAVPGAARNEPGGTAGNWRPRELRKQQGKQSAEREIRKGRFWFWFCCCQTLGAPISSPVNNGRVGLVPASPQS